LLPSFLGRRNYGMTDGDWENLAVRVSPQNARSYALAHGWQRIAEANGGIALFQRPENSLDQLVVPLHTSGPDYGRRITDLVFSLAEVENRPAREIVNDLLMPDADTIRYRVVSAAAASGDLPLDDGLRVLEGAKRSLLAAACSVVAPVKNHPRMSRVEAMQLLEGCRLRQTERGSYVIAIACPLRAVDTGDPIFDQFVPFTRQATELLMRSAVRVVKAIEADDVGSLYEQRSGEPVVSANFCDALLRMQPADDHSELSISATWASTLPPNSQEPLPRVATFQHDYFPILQDVYSRLSATQEPTPSLFVGYVDTLNGNIGGDGRVQGDTRFLLVLDDELVKARTDLGADDYRIAVEAHAAGEFVAFQGVLHRGRRTHRITELRNLKLLASTT
jgi:hypothetical protein